MTLVISETKDSLTDIHQITVTGWPKEEIEYQPSIGVNYTPEEKRLAQFDHRHLLMQEAVIKVVQAIDEHRERV